MEWNMGCRAPLRPIQYDPLHAHEQWHCVSSDHAYTPRHFIPIGADRVTLEIPAACWSVTDTVTATNSSSSCLMSGRGPQNLEEGPGR